MAGEEKEEKKSDVGVLRLRETNSVERVDCCSFEERIDGLRGTVHLLVRCFPARD